MGDVLDFPRRLVNRDQLREWAEQQQPLPPGTHDVPPRFSVWQGPDKAAFVQAAPDPQDPPGTIRWVAIQPDGTRQPRGARIAGE